MAVKRVCAIRIWTLINHIGAYHLYFPYLKMPLQSMRLEKRKKKNLSKAPTNWKWKFIYLANKTLHAVKHSACGVIGSGLLVVLALRYVSQKLFSLHCVFSPAELRSFNFFGLWLPSQLYPVETLERRPTPGSFSAMVCCFLAQWCTPAGRATRPLASPLATAPPMAPGPAQHQIALVGTTTFTFFEYR